jgi:hypothetical protein
MSGIKAWLGMERDETGWKEKIVASAGGFLAIAGLVGFGRHFFGSAPESFIVKRVSPTYRHIFEF